MRGWAALLVFGALLLPGAALGEEEIFLSFEFPGAGGVAPDGIVAGSWSVECHKDPMEDYRYCFIAQNLETSEFVSKHSDMTIRYNEGGKAYLWAGPGDQHPARDQIIRIDANEPHRSPSNEPFLIDVSLRRELEAGAKIRTRWYNWPYEAQQDQELSLTGITATLDLVGKIVEGKAFALPEDSLYRFYFWEGMAYGGHYAEVKHALTAEYEWQRCPDPGFDLEAAKGAALAKLPGVAGAAFKAGFADAIGDMIYMMRNEKCQAYIDHVRAGPSPIAGMEYP